MTAQKPLVTDAGTTQQLQAGNQIEINAGTAALPALTIDGDPNTGLFSPGADQLAVSTAGTQRMVVDASGNVGIGTATPGSLVEARKDQNAQTLLNVSNTTNAGSARGAIAVGSSSAQVYLFALSGTYSDFTNIAQDLPPTDVAGVFFPGGGQNSANVVGSLFAGKPIDIIPNMAGGSRVFRVDTSGRVIVGGTGTSTTTNRLDVRDGSAVPGATVFSVTDAGNVGVKTGSPAAVVDIVAGTTTSTLPALKATATSGGAADVSSVSIAVTSGTTGNSDAAVDARISGASVVAYSTHAVQGVNTTTQTISSTLANAGGPIGVRGVTTGTNGSGVQTNDDPAATYAGRTGNVGVLGYAGNSTVNIGVGGAAIAAKNNASNVGVSGKAENGGTGTAALVGGLFSVSLPNPASYDPSYADSAALIADNCNTTLPIFLARDRGVVTFTIADSGYVTSQNTTDSTTAFQVQDQGGTTVLDVDTTNQRVGIGTTTPNARLTIDGGTSTAEELLLAKTSANGNAVVTVRNDTSGSAAQASLYLQTDPGAGRYSSFAVTSNGWTPNGLSLPNQYQSHPDTGLTNGMLFATEAANAPIVFAVPTVNGNGFATTSERLRVNGAEVVVNDGVQNVDFRVESQSNANMLFVDASANAVGIGTSTPSTQLHVQGSVAGDLASRVENTNASGAASVQALNDGGAATFVNAYGSTNAGNIWNGQAAASWSGVGSYNTTGLAFTAGGSAGRRMAWATYASSEGTINLRAEIEAGGAFVVNPTGDTITDLRVESDTNTHMLFVDASADAVGIGTTTPTSTAQIAGSLALAITSTSVGITLDATHYTVLCNTSGGGFTITLPAASTCSGRVYVVKNTSTNTATVQGNGAETIDGSNTYALSTQYQTVTLQCDGTAWFIL